MCQTTHFRESTYGQEDNGDDEANDKEEASSSSSCSSLVLVSRDKLAICRARVGSDGRDIVLDVV